MSGDEETTEESSDWYGHPRTLKLKKQVERTIEIHRENVCAMVASGTDLDKVRAMAGALVAYQFVRDEWFNRPARSGK